MSLTHNEVMEFINHFTADGSNREVIRTFSNGCCYWFAEILFQRFRGEGDCEIIYDPIINHWACRLGDKIYDITGDISNSTEYSWENWDEYAAKDAAHTKRLYRDCINFNYLSSQLSPCPNCGSTNIIEYICCGPLPSDSGYYYLCRDCGHESPFANEREDAIHLWNNLT